MNSLQETIEVVNYSAGFMALLEIFNLDGTLVASMCTKLDSADDSAATPLTISYPEGLTPVYFLRLIPTQGGTLRSSNFYFRGREEGDIRAILPLARQRLRPAPRPSGRTTVG